MNKTLSLKSLKGMSRQQIFNFVANHLLTQNKKSINGDSCVYRSPDGLLMCAAGCLISDQEYHKSFENKGWRSLVNRKIVPNRCADLIVSLQRIHDEKFPIYWKDELKWYAEQHGLTFNPPPEVEQCQSGK